MDGGIDSLNYLLRLFWGANMLSNDELVPAVFYLAGGRIRSSTRLQKLFS
jgi:hypothetical protein